MKRIRAIAYKELLHIIRDPRSLAVALLMPLMMLLLYGYAMNMELENLPVGILDLDRSPASRALVSEMTSSGFIVAREYLHNREEIEPGFRHGSFRAALIIPDGYERGLVEGPGADVQVMIDGSDGSTAATVNNYLNAVIARKNQELMRDVTGETRPPLSARVRYLFNPQLVSTNFIVPGLVAIVLVMICALLTSIAIAREKETGTMEQILTTPVLAKQVIIGKVIPYLVIAVIDTVVIFTVGRLLFKIPMNGSWLALSAYSLVYLVIALSLGLLISTVAKTQQVAMMLALSATLLPNLLLSGFIFDLASMPVALQWFSRIIPATYFIKIIRGVMLIGRNWFPLEGGIMTIMAVTLLYFAVHRFRERLE